MTIAASTIRSAIQAYQRGDSLRAAAAAHGVSHERLRYWIRVNGVQVRAHGGRHGRPESRPRRLEALLAACRADVGALPPGVRAALVALEAP